MTIPDFLLAIAIFLHTLPMNLLTGGLILSGCLLWLKRAEPDSPIAITYNHFPGTVPLLLAFTVTQSTLSLILFYLIFTQRYSAFELSYPHLSVAIFILLASFATQVKLAANLKKQNLNSKTKEHKIAHPALLILNGFFLSIITYCLNNNASALLHSDFFSKIFTRVIPQLLYQCLQPCTILAYLHVLLASIAVASLLIGGYGYYFHKPDSALSRENIKVSATIYTIITLIQAPVGGLYYNLLSSQMMLRISGQNTVDASIFLLFIFTMTVSLFCLWYSAITALSKTFLLGFYSALITVFLMLITNQRTMNYTFEGFRAAESKSMMEAKPYLITTIFIALLCLLNYIFLYWRLNPGRQKPD